VNNLRVYAPKIYEDIIEMLALLDAESRQFSILDAEILKVKNNQYVSTADETGIKLFEQILGITADTDADSLEFRKQRVINRFSTTESPTAKSLRNQLDILLGKNNYEIDFVYSDYQINLITHIGVRGGVEELLKTLVIIVSANILTNVQNILAGGNQAIINVGSALDLAAEYVLSCDVNLQFSINAQPRLAQATDLSVDYMLSSDVVINTTVQADRKLATTVDAGTIYEIQ
jgi:hypothetical protein